MSMVTLRGKLWAAVHAYFRASREATAADHSPEAIAAVDASLDGYNAAVDALARTDTEQLLIETAVRLVELRREARADVGKTTTATERVLACFRVLEACVDAYAAEQRKAGAS